MKDKAITYISNEIKKDLDHFLYSYLPLTLSSLYDSLRGDPCFEEIERIQKKKYEERKEKFGKM